MNRQRITDSESRTNRARTFIWRYEFGNPTGKYVLFCAFRACRLLFFFRVRNDRTVAITLPTAVNGCAILFLPLFFQNSFCISIKTTYFLTYSSRFLEHLVFQFIYTSFQDFRYFIVLHSYRGNVRRLIKIDLCLHTFFAFIRNHICYKIKILFYNSRNFTIFSRSIDIVVVSSHFFYQILFMFPWKYTFF